MTFKECKVILFDVKQRQNNVSTDRLGQKKAHIMSSEDTTHRKESYMSDSVGECSKRLGDIELEYCLRGQEQRNSFTYRSH